MGGPTYKSGTEVLYKNTAHGTLERARISEVHLDDVEPYYSIRLLDEGREKQTDDSRLFALEDGAERRLAERGGTSTEGGGRPVQTEQNRGVQKFVPPLYKAGMNVFYKNIAYGTIDPARIVEVHLDDVEPYYSIRLAGDGREKQTDDSRIILAFNDGEAEEREPFASSMEEGDSVDDGSMVCCIRLLARFFC
mmetsp:Transcript_50368/g.107272  ORF Transcript_50368/g.107272 Transcript_50368/m.107272 type:complete len:193 (+) Transcript_50368:115-693(+)|eukprot:CAMPEP_0172557776 /NCGR_PEP_ID=MMETSP1067-20121228/75221_1 /TAXON_ID=265564 ORGANISM="Thalassiosira punctigera, Strain Tpunct2005C2" /NCGR_SAMPLE_ID=MMETSP1067 /ASSEMBLY_ACC=CAM_ASM_000444 /LENGTH=192 /DNA_ID=CAMNT_0013346947 /DNA_START=26 /DNA_END=604 /DNA_ORIENTATION=-